MKLVVVIEPCEEGGFHAWVPSLPGCHSEGETEEEAVQNIQEAIELYVVSRNGVHARIHSLGIDLTGDKDQFGRQAEELCEKMEGIVQLAVGRSWELATALA